MSLKAYLKPKHCTAVYNSLWQILDNFVLLLVWNQLQLSVTERLLFLVGRGQMPYSMNISTSRWWRGHCINLTLPHCLSHLSKCFNNARQCILPCLREVILCLIYCSWLQTWTGSWLRLKHWQNVWERRACLSVRKLSLTAPVWGKCQQLSPGWGRFIYLDTQTQYTLPRLQYLQLHSVTDYNPYASGSQLVQVCWDFVPTIH